MEMDGLDRYPSLETALNGAGFKVDNVEKQGKKTVITVFRYGQSAKNPVSPVFKPMPTAVSPEEQRVNGREA
jgi:hypothetical protein